MLQHLQWSPKLNGLLETNRKHHHPTTYTDNLWNLMNGYMTRKRNQLWIEANKTEMARYERASYKNYYKFWFLVHETYDSLMQFEGRTNIYIYIYLCDSRKNCFSDSRKFQFEHSHMYVPFGMHMCLDHRISAKKKTGSKKWEWWNEKGNCGCHKNLV